MLLGTKLILPDLSRQMPKCIVPIPKGFNNSVDLSDTLTLWLLHPSCLGPAQTVRLYSLHFSFSYVMYSLTSSVHAFTMNDKYMELQYGERWLNVDICLCHNRKTIPLRHMLNVTVWQYCPGHIGAIWKL